MCLFIPTIALSFVQLIILVHIKIYNIYRYNCWFDVSFWFTFITSVSVVIIPGQ